MSEISSITAYNSSIIANGYNSTVGVDIADRRPAARFYQTSGITNNKVCNTNFKTRTDSYIISSDSCGNLAPCENITRNINLQDITIGSINTPTTPINTTFIPSTNITSIPSANTTSISPASTTIIPPGTTAFVHDETTVVPSISFGTEITPANTTIAPVETMILPVGLGYSGLAVTVAGYAVTAVITCYGVSCLWGWYRHDKQGIDIVCYPMTCLSSFLCSGCPKTVMPYVPRARGDK